MKRISGTKAYARAILRTGLALGLVFLCLDMVVEGRERSKGKEKKKGVLVSKPKAKKAEEEEGVDVTYKEIKGEVSGIGPNFIMVTYSADTKGGKKTEYDICLTIGEDLEVANVRELSEIKVGYAVSVRYEEKRKGYEKKLKDGTVKQGTKIAGREAKKITFLNYGSKAKGVLSSD